MKEIDLEKYCLNGERLYLTYLDGDDQVKCLGGNIVQIIGNAIIFKVKTSSEYDRVLVIYTHRIKKIEDLHKNKFILN